MNYEIAVHMNTDADFDAALDFAISAVSSQALKDCNFYCKQDTGALIQSSLIHSDFKTGELKWTMPYAEKQYYFPGTRQDKNPNASPEWCDVAENNHGSEWESVFQRAYERGLR